MQGPFLRAGLWYLSSLFLNLVCVIPIGMGCVPGGVGEANQGPLLRTGLRYLSGLFLTFVCVIRALTWDVSQAGSVRLIRAYR